MRPVTRSRDRFVSMRYLTAEPLSAGAKRLCLGNFDARSADNAQPCRGRFAQFLRMVGVETGAGFGAFQQGGGRADRGLGLLRPNGSDQERELAEHDGARHRGHAVVTMTEE